MSENHSQLAKFRARFNVMNLNNYLASYQRMQGNPKVVNLLSVISSYYRAKGFLAWFEDNDLRALLLDAYCSAILTRHLIQVCGVARARYVPSEMLYALLSNNSDVGCWMSQYFAADFYEKKRSGYSCNNPSSLLYNFLQVKIATQGDWPALSARAEYYLKNVPKNNVLYRIDNQFYKALAEGDIAAMETVLCELVLPKVHNVRGRESYFTCERGLISPWGVILAKLAWLHGYEVDIQHPLIPSDWLSMQPLEMYEMPLEEFNGFDIFSTLPPVGTEAIADAGIWSPRSPNQSPLTYVDACQLAGIDPIV